MSDWCILRTSGRSTLPLAASLSDAGYEVWTPSQVPLNAPRRRRTDDEEEPRCPIIPTYVFARARHLFELIALSANPGRNHAGFSVFRMAEGVPLIAERALAGLRAEEAKMEEDREVRALRKRSKRRGISYPVGETVRIPSAFPSFAGMDGCVEESDPRFTHVGFGGFLRLKISTFILRENELSPNDNSRGACTGAAA